ncbi:lipopolysaccharide assembly protein LapB [Iodobacter sp.]|uniref:tetratricopeptide repeat protein n=1 Tax=Iodobacter sp. TaxID=1915058 RepID=UPI0025DE1CAF|nr:tetratricopeptide repeat protein [Iodobacter sp.]
MHRYIVMFCLAFLTFIAQASQADIKQLLNDKKYAEAEKQLKAQLQANPKDDIALLGLGQIPVLSGDSKHLAESITYLEKCIEINPNSSACHLWLGNTYGTMVQNSGMLTAAKYASKIKAEFARAVELDPQSYEARDGLNNFYLQAPGIVGGSISKAKANTEEFAKLQPNLGHLLRASVLIAADKFEHAQAELLLTKAGDELDALLNTWLQLGLAYLNDNQADKSAALFQRLLTQYPNQASFHLGLGKSLLEQSKLDPAIQSLEQAVHLDKNIGAQYRLAIAYQRKGDKQKAIANFEQFLALKINKSSKAVDEANTRLNELKKAS